MFETFVRRPVLSLVISLFITLLGVLALFTLPVTQFPDIVPPSVVVTANYTGANAEVCTDAVAIPLERAINGVPGMTYMSSVSTNNGTTLIQVFFKVGTNPDIAAVNVQNRVTTILDELPEEVIKAGVTTEKEVNSMLMYLNVFSDNAQDDERFIYNFTDINILKELKRIEGVGLVQIMGMKDYAMRVWLKPERLAAYNLSSDDIINAIRAQNVEAAPGQTGIGSDKRSNMLQYVLRYPGKFSTPDQYKNIPVRANPDGSVLRIRDIADVEFGSLDYEMVSKTDGRPSASIMLKQLPGSNAQEVIERVKQRMEELKGSFPPGMRYTLSYDVSRFLDASMHEVFKTLIEAFLLVFIVVFVFLQDWRSTLIPALAVPVALIGALFCMQLLGFSLNLLTLFALVLAIGIVVDNAIVVVEAVHSKMEEEHLSPMDATLAAMKEISGAIVAITLVMSAVFIPVAFLSGPVGIFYSQFSLTLAASIIISGINALTLTPALCALMLRPPTHHDKKKGLLGRFFTSFNHVYNKMSRKYTGLIGRIAARRTVTLAILAVSFIATWGVNAILPGGFIPTEDQGMIYVNVTTPAGATVDRTEAVLNEVDRISRKIGSVETVSTLAGYSLVNEVTGSSYGMAMINLKPWDERKESVNDMIQILREKTAGIKDADIEFFPPPTVPGFGNSSGFELRLLDRTGKDDIKETARVLNEFMTALRETPEVGNAFSSFNPTFPQYMIHVDYDVAAKKGVSIENAMSTLQTLLGSFYASNFIRFGQMYKVMVQALPGDREKPEDVLRMYVKNTAGEMVPYSSFIRMEKIYGPEQVTRYNMFTSAMVSGEAAEGYSSGQVIEAIERVAAEKLPKGFAIEWSGMTREQILSGNQAIYVFLLCLLFVYMLLAAQYESFLLPLPVIFCLPAGIFGSFLFLKLAGLENNIYAQVAMVMLIGLLGKNAILIIEFAVQKTRHGSSVLQAAIEGAALRLRPILMTSFAFISGLIPLCMASGAGALGNRSIGFTAVGGMLIGTIVGVVLIPGLFVLFSKKKKKASPATAPVVMVVLICLLATACGPAREAALPAKKALPASFARSTDSATIARIRWQNFFNDPNLTGLIDTALRNNPDLLQAVHRVEIASRYFKISKNAKLPSLEAAAEAGLRKYGFYTIDGIGNYDTNFSENLKEDEKLPDPVPDYFVGLRASWEIDLWGKLKRRKKAAFSRFLAANEGRRLAQTILISEVANKYFQLLALDNQLSVLQKTIDLQRKSLSLISVQKQGGRANELGVLQARAVLLQSQGLEEDIRQSIRETENAINYLLGRFSQPIARSSITPVSTPLTDSIKTGLPETMVALRPDIRQAELLLMAAESDKEAARAAFYPTLSLNPFVGFQSFRLSEMLNTPKSVAYGLMGGISAPLFNHGFIRNQYQQQLAERSIAFREYEKTVLNAWKEVQDCLAARKHLQERNKYALLEVETLNKAIEASDLLFKAGRANYLEVITTQSRALEAQINLTNIHYKYLQSRVDLYRVLGGGWN